MHEVVPLKKEWLSQRDRECVREAVAIVQASAMASLSEAAERPTRKVAVLGVDRHELDARSAEDMIEVAQSFGAVSGVDDDGDLRFALGCGAEDEDAGLVGVAASISSR